MKWFTKAFIYIMLIGGIVGLAGLGVYLITAGRKANDNTLQWMSYITFGATAILLVMAFLLRKKIALTAALFKESCRAVQHNPALFLVAAIVIALLLGFLALWLSSFVYLYSISDRTVDSAAGSDELFNPTYRNLMWYQLFVGLWTIAVLSAVFQHSIAGGVASWYFDRQGLKRSGSRFGSPALKSLGWAFTKSFGSLALGSLIVAIVQFINFLLEKAKQANRQNKVLRAILSCVQCLLGSLQAVIEWINKFAFIYIAMHGESFCKSSRGVFKLMSRNLFNAVVVDLITDFVLLVGKLLGTAAVTFVALVAMDSEGGQSTIRPLTLIAIAVGSYLIFNLVANIVNTGVDTVLICYLEDIERNRDGALHMDVELHNLLQARTQELKVANTA